MNASFTNQQSALHTRAEHRFTIGSRHSIRARGGGHKVNIGTPGARVVAKKNNDVTTLFSFKQYFQKCFTQNKHKHGKDLNLHTLFFVVERNGEDITLLQRSVASNVLFCVQQIKYFACVLLYFFGLPLGKTKK